MLNKAYGEKVSSAKKSTDEAVKFQGVVGCVFFFYWKGIVHHEYVPRGQMVNSCTRKFSHG
jgi:hypothetical protein